MDVNGHVSSMDCISVEFCAVRSVGCCCVHLYVCEGEDVEILPMLLLLILPSSPREEGREVVIGWRERLHYGQLQHQLTPVLTVCILSVSVWFWVIVLDIGLCAVCVHYVRLLDMFHPDSVESLLTHIL